MLVSELSAYYYNSKSKTNKGRWSFIFKYKVNKKIKTWLFIFVVHKTFTPSCDKYSIIFI